MLLFIPAGADFKYFIRGGQGGHTSDQVLLGKGANCLKWICYDII